MTAQIVLTQGRQKCRELLADDRVRRGLRVAAYGGAGFFLSAAALGNRPQPLALGLITAATGWRSCMIALGSVLGYGVFWGAAGVQGMIWSALGVLAALFLGKRKFLEEIPLLLPALCGLLVAATGLAFQILGEDTAVTVYLLRIVLGAASSRMYTLVFRRGYPVADWLAEGAAVLALAQVSALGWVQPGYILACALALRDAFPAAALAGLALDLANVSPVPMTAVLCAIYLTRLIPGLTDSVRRLLPGGVYLLVMLLCGTADPRPMAGFIIGGLVSGLLPARPEIAHRRGQTGIAQVRLEVMAGVLSQTQQLLMEAPEVPIDREALLARTRERACGSCPNRKSCTVSAIPENLLQKPLLDTASLPFPCRKPGRMILELRRSQEQYRALRADRDRRREYRQAVVQQYRFLSDYLRQLSDQLPRRAERLRECFKVDTGIATAGKEPANGDKCLCFYGTGCRYYVLLCDGMGTGLGASQAGRTGADMLRQMLTAGFPAEHALGSLNSLLALRGQAGAVTVDLAEIRLDTGRTNIYKWGAAPSYVLRAEGAEKIGTAGPPPGIDLLSARETVDRLSLRRGETLILLSDGVEAGEYLQSRKDLPGEAPGELAARLLELGACAGTDDATVAAIRLYPLRLST